MVFRNRRHSRRIGQIDSLGDSGNRIPRFRPQLAPDEKDHQHRNQRDGQQRREADGERLRPGQRPKHAPFLRFQQKDRQERNHDDDQREENRRADLLGRIEQNSCVVCGFGQRRRLRLVLMLPKDAGTRSRP